MGAGPSRRVTVSGDGAGGVTLSEDVLRRLDTKGELIFDAPPTSTDSHQLSDEGCAERKEKE